MPYDSVLYQHRHDLHRAGSIKGDDNDPASMNDCAYLPCLCAAGCAAAPGARAQSDQQQWSTRRSTWSTSFHNPGNYIDNVRALVRRSRAIIIVPNMVKAGFIFGAQGGPGVLAGS